MSDGTNDHRDNPDRPRTRPRPRTVRDPHHDAQLLRHLALTNADVHARLGALPPGGLPVKPRRTPKLPLPSSVIAASAIYPPEDDPMKLHHLAAAAILPMAVAAAGCSKGIDVGNDGATGHLNPHPVKRYEVIATSHAPGPWDSFEGGYIGYDVINTKCVPMIPFIGEQHVPNTGLDVPMTRVDDHTWKGYFYRDAMLDEDYFKLGVCHWDVTSVGVGAIAQGVRFSWGAGGEAFEELLRDSPEISYFKKSAYGDRSLAPYGAPDYSSLRPEYKQNPDDFFPVTIAVKEAKP